MQNLQQLSDRFWKNAEHELGSIVTGNRLPKRLSFITIILRLIIENEKLETVERKVFKIYKALFVATDSPNASLSS